MDALELADQGQRVTFRLRGQSSRAKGHASQIATESGLVYAQQLDVVGIADITRTIQSGNRRFLDGMRVDY